MASKGVQEVEWFAEPKGEGWEVGKSAASMFEKKGVWTS